MSWFKHVSAAPCQRCHCPFQWRVGRLGLLNRCQMLSQTFLPFWSLKSLSKHSWTRSWITQGCQGHADVLDGMRNPCNQSRADASCPERSLHCNFPEIYNLGDTDGGTMGVYVGRGKEAKGAAWIFYMLRPLLNICFVMKGLSYQWHYAITQCSRG